MNSADGLQVVVDTVESPEMDVAIAMSIVVMVMRVPGDDFRLISNIHQDVTVHYNPSDPQVAVLEMSAEAAQNQRKVAIFFLVFAVPVFVACVLMYLN
jgi:hypothetical protein